VERVTDAFEGALDESARSECRRPRGEPRGIHAAHAHLLKHESGWWERWTCRRLADSVADVVTTQVSVDPDAELLARLRRGDEMAFRTLVDRYGASMLRVARLHVRDREAAAEVVQETWLALVRGLEQFEERSTLKTWLFRILTNRAKTRGEREGRSVPFSALVVAAVSGQDPAVDADRFQGPGDAEPGHWAASPRAWQTLPDEHLLSQETLRRVSEAIELLPPAQRAVIRLRDVEGWDAEEVCAVLELSPGNQRVLLHRARSKVRSALEHYIGDGVDSA
jgi:RNA polymerase sigma-70 factor (ECF subfamily)